MPNALIFAHIEAVNKSNEIACAEFAEVKPIEEIIASASAPIMPFVANAFNNSSLVHVALAIASPVVASINPNLVNKASFSVADNCVFAKA